VGGRREHRIVAARSRRERAGLEGSSHVPRGIGSGSGIGRAEALDEITEPGRRRTQVGDHLGDHKPQRVQVGAGIDGFAGELLGRHVAQGAEDFPVAGQLGPRVVDDAGDPEVGQAGPTVLGVEEDVRGLDVPMDHARPMRVGQGFGDLSGYSSDVRKGDGSFAPQALGQRFALDELEDDRGGGWIVDDVMDGHDPGMGQAGSGPSLGDEAPPPRLVGEEPRLEDLDRDRAIEALVVGSPDVGHPAATHLALQAIAVEQDLARLEPVGGRLGKGSVGAPRPFGAAIARRRSLHAAIERHRRGNPDCGLPASAYNEIARLPT
jgi:hypothetical protein